MNAELLAAYCVNKFQIPPVPISKNLLQIHSQYVCVCVNEFSLQKKCVYINHASGSGKNRGIFYYLQYKILHSFAPVKKL